MAKGFRIAARALRQLGAELITSDDVALNELIKNAFDAKSPRVQVYISAPLDSSALQLIEEKLAIPDYSINQAKVDFSNAFDPSLGAADKSSELEKFSTNATNKIQLAQYLNHLRAHQFYIKIIDTGNGMNEDELVNSFLVIGTPNKFLLKKSEEQSTLLGEKGVGRLSMMRLGNNSTVSSKQKGKEFWYQIKFDWSLFDDPNLFLEDVEIPVIRAQNDKVDVKGTSIVINKLSTNWNATKVKGFINKYIRRLQNPFSKILMPYPIDIFFNDNRQDIRALPHWLSKQAQFEAEFKFDPSGIEGTDKVLRRKIKWKGSETFDTRSWTLKELTSSLATPEAIFKNLGPIEAKCLWFNRSRFDKDLDHSLSEIRDELNLWCGGFGIYRDGFRVGLSGGMEDDWLEWDSAALKSQGYSLNRYQTVGSIDISSRLNPFLVDAANREKLVACPEQQLLISIFGNTLREDLKGRIAIVFDAQAKSAIAEESTETSIRRSEESLKTTMKNLAEIGRVIPPSEKHKFDAIQASIKDQIEYLGTVNTAL